MTYVPQYRPSAYRLLAVDPGTVKMGVSMFEVDPITRKIYSIRSQTLYPPQLPNTTALVEDLHKETWVRLNKTRERFSALLREEQPHHVVYEAPFMNRLQPTAYGPLVALMTMVHWAVMDYNQSTPFKILPPLTVKKFIGVAGKKGKEVVVEAIRKIPNLMHALEQGECVLDELDDNAVDSIAVGYAAISLDLLEGTES